MATIVKGTQQYGAEVQLQRLMKEQHIDDPEMVADIEWFGWQKHETTDAKGFLSPPSWNVALILTSLVSSLISVSPYPYLIDRSTELLWLFPLLRSFGSLLCVVSVQLALQIRIHHIATTSLLLMKARKRFPLPTEEAIRDRNTLLESRLRDLRDELGRLPDPEKQPGRTTRHQTDIQREAEARGLSQNLLLPLLRAILVVGMGMIVTGYIGCFNIVGRTDAEGGPCVWFAMEAFLAMVRITLWGWNPTWDECGTGMTLRLDLRSRDLTQGTPSSNSLEHHSQTSFTPLLMPESSVKLTDADRLAPDPIPSFPLITATRFLSDLTKTSSKSVWSMLGWDDVSLIVESIEDFLAAATPYVGPLRRLQAEELKGISLYCGIVPDEERKLLCMTACRDDSRWVSISILADGSTLPYAIYTSRSRDLLGTRALLVDLQDEVQTGSITVIDQRTFDLLVDYSSRLFNRLCMVDNSINQLPLSWTVTLPSLPSSENMRKSILLTAQDKAYIKIRQVHDLKRDYCLSRSNRLIGVFPYNVTEERHDGLVEWALILDSAIMEVYLYILEHRYVQSLSLSPPQSRRLALEWIRSMEDRISLEKESCQRRRGGVPQDKHLKLSLYRVAYDQLVQELRSLRQLPVGGPMLEDWKRIITILMDEPNTLPAVPELFAHPPVQRLNLGAIRPLFLVPSGNPSADYQNMVAFIRSSLHRLRDLKASSLHDRIDPWGPGSPEFSPPYTFVSELPTTTAKALADQFESVQMIQLRSYSVGTTSDTLRLLDTISPSPSLTTVAFLYEVFDDHHTLLVSAILQRHRGIICLAFQECTFADRPLIDDSITANRRKWKEEAHSGGVFTYSVGCEIRPGDYTSSSPFTIYHHDIMLSDFADLFAMMYIPHDGKVIPNLSLQAPAQDITLVATLTPSGKSAEGGGSGDDFTTQSDVGVSHGFRPVTIAGFPDVKAGCYELRIRQVRHRVQYLFRKLTIDFIAASDRVEPPVESGAERRLVPDE
ncbi:hypothetical protein PQX77_017353 [Marasmius sp. AFHP31]|nr:hypothetical protein PQX77_017353 [Marasmius sp. AFHP31]